MHKICIIAGPTAIGKTNISINLAKSICGEIISADSAQVYKYMNIGTAKINSNEMNGIAHYMIDEVTPDTNFSVAEFRLRAEKYIELISNNNKLPIIVGGTGLYINSLLNNLDFTDSIKDEQFRSEMQELARSYGNAYIHNMLKCIDPVSYEKLYPNDIKRVVRALEVYKYTGRPISYFQAESKKLPSRYDFCYIGLTMERQKLYDRIDKRVDFMIEAGLINEVKNILNMGYDRNLVSMQAIGYKEIVKYLYGEITLDETIRIIKRDSRHYAKRQFTWFKNDPRIFWINLDSHYNHSHAIENIIRFIAGKFTLI